MEETNDWLSSIKQNTGNGDAEFNLGEVEPGDRLLIVTAHTQYDFVFVGGRDANLASSQDDRPQGRVRIMGCTLGDSPTIKPDSIFCGGHLEFTYERGTKTYLTSSIKEIRSLRRREER